MLKTSYNPRKGDGGAPLICNADNGEWFLHGISIYGPGCNKPGGGPSVFVKPSVFLTFIEVLLNYKKGIIKFLGRDGRLRKVVLTLSSEFCKERITIVNNVNKGIHQIEFIRHRRKHFWKVLKKQYKARLLLKYSCYKCCLDC